jgi:hypothetical protein
MKTILMTFAGGVLATAGLVMPLVDVGRAQGQGRQAVRRVRRLRRSASSCRSRR